MLVLTFLALALAVAAAPPIPVVQVTDSKAALPFTRRIRPSTKTIAETDRARAAHYLSMAKSRGGVKRQNSLPITNQAVIYTAEVGVGTPPTNYTLIIDTGSSNTWVGAGKKYTTTSSSNPTGDAVFVSYGSGAFLGAEFTDTVTLTETLVIANQSIGDAVLDYGFDDFDGILGIGPTNLTVGTLVPSVTSSVPTVTDNLFTQGKISQKVVGVFFAPSINGSDTNGKLTFGGVDMDRTTSPITFVAITSTSPSSEFFGINQTLSYDSNRNGKTLLNNTAGIIDTGTTLTLLETNAFNDYVSLTGATEDETTGLLQISPENYANLQSLFFHIGGTTFEFTKNAQTFPRALNSAISGSPDSIYLIIGDLGSLGGNGMDFINGMTFLERFYSVFDSTNNRVGFATTAHTFDETN